MLKFTIQLYLLAILLHQTRTGRMERLERKIHAMEMSVIQDVHMLREDLISTNEKLENIIELMNDTAKQQVRTEHISTSKTLKEAEDIIAKRTEARVEEIVMKEVRRIRRAFVNQKMHVTEVQNAENSKLNSQAMEQKRSLNKLTEKVDRKVHNGSQIMKEMLDQFTQQVGAQLDVMRDSVQKSLRMVNRGVNTSLLEIAERSETMDGSFETKMDDLFLLVQHYSNNTILHEIVKDVRYLTAVTEGRRVRLGNSSSIKHGIQGRLEVLYHNIWGTVCDDDFDNVDATVACKMLGYQQGTFKREAFFGKGSGPILLDNTDCNTGHYTLFDCAIDFDTSDCSHNEDVGVICTN